MNTTTTLRKALVAAVITGAALGATAVAGPAYATTDRLNAGQSLTAGQSLYAGSFRVTMQSDGNLVEYKGSAVIWSSHTQGGGAHATMQTDGNFVIYSTGGAALYSSATAPTSSDHIVIQTDGNFVIYSGSGKAIWDSYSDNTRRAAVGTAATKLGTAYVYGAAGPNNFDCSGLTQWSYAQWGVGLQRTADNQFHSTTPIPYSQVEVGDLLFWSDNGGASVTHVGMVYDNLAKTFIEAPHTGDVVKIASIAAQGASQRFMGAARVIGVQP